MLPLRTYLARLLGDRAAAFPLASGRALAQFLPQPRLRVNLPQTVSNPPPSDRSRWFTEEVHAHDGQLKAWLRGNYPAVRDVDDVVQESYLRLWKAAAREPIRSAKGLLYLVARRVALNFIRKDRNAPFDAYGETAALRVIEDKPDAAETAVLKERIDLLADALMSLPPRCREIVILHKVQGLTQKAVAEQLGLSERTVETHIRVGVGRCYDYLRAHGLPNLHGHES